METRIYLKIVVPDDTSKGQVIITVSKWDDDELIYNSRPYNGVAFAAPLMVEHSVYPYTMAALRDATDRAIADMMEKFARGEVLLMYKTGLKQK